MLKSPELRKNADPQ
ncbi:hypothetical protein Bhyg_01267 [Pseudolycoriella hygida]|uniref:Uncharacterized protein n=1 Tax=Pseudolycoriella hygida TaxID=35572 RepID=A0A9Q0S6P4_9DIPT|nr:hypothetical protein Bhyg_01267 [Pseudolycoriella hygida]